MLIYHSNPRRYPLNQRLYACHTTLQFVAGRGFSRTGFRLVFMAPSAKY